MDDPSNHILLCKASCLIRLLEDSTGSPWSRADYRHILAHELTTPMRAELEAAADGPGASFARSPWLDKSFADLFKHPEPPGPLLRRVKDFAKEQRLLNGHLPKEVATVLYYAAVAVALCRSNERISSLDDADLIEGFDWVLAREWVQDELKAIFMEARRRLGREHSP